MPQNLSEKSIAALKYTGKDYTVRDLKVKGLFVQVNKHCRSFKIQGDLWAGGRPVRTVRMTLGRWPDMKLDRARNRAAELMAQIKSGIDPARQAEPEVKRLWTVGEAYAEYVSELQRQGRAARTGADMLYRLDKHVPDWKARPIDTIDGLALRAAHKRITAENGPRTADQVRSEFGTVWRFAAPLLGRAILQFDPTEGVRPNGKKQRRQVCVTDLPLWWARVETLSPLRRNMQKVGLLSGMRPGNLCSIRLDWISLEHSRISFPAEVMKKREAFVLPLSPVMVGIVRETIELVRITEPTSDWLFPTRSKTNALMHTRVWRDHTLDRRDASGKLIINESGHLLRHTYSNLALGAGLTDSDVMRLLGQRAPRELALRDTYTSDAAQFERLLRLQCQVSDFIMGKVQP